MRTRKSRPEQVEILLVEDNTDEAYLIGECFDEAKIKHILHNVKDGASAVDFLHRKDRYNTAPRPDLIILDLKLPKLSGRDVLVQIKEVPDLRHIPVVVLSGARFEEVGIPAGPIYDVMDMHADPQTADRNMTPEVEHPTAGKMKTLGPPVKFSRTPASVRAPAPLYGQHTREVLVQHGFSEVEIGAFLEEVAMVATEDQGAQEPEAAQA